MRRGRTGRERRTKVRRETGRARDKNKTKDVKRRTKVRMSSDSDVQEKREKRKGESEEHKKESEEHERESGIKKMRQRNTRREWRT